MDRGLHFDPAWSLSLSGRHRNCWETNKNKSSLPQSSLNTVFPPLLRHTPSSPPPHPPLCGSSLRLIVMTSKNVTAPGLDSPACPAICLGPGGTEITIFYISEENAAAQYQFQVLMNGEVYIYISLAQNYVMVSTLLTTTMGLGLPSGLNNIPRPREVFPQHCRLPARLSLPIVPLRPHPTPSQ